jgi:hypothetical protein
MSEWWTYSLSDFLLFSPRTYYRLFELYNADIWPGQVVALGLGVVIAVLVRHPSVWAGRVAAVSLAACWLWVAWSFHLDRYATINWAAAYFAAGFALQAVLLAWSGLFQDGLRFKAGTDPVGRAGLALVVFALFLQPIGGPAGGREWTQVEVFGIAPDPTAVATLGFVVAAEDRLQWELMTLPLVWCLVSGATLWAMDSPEALVVWAAGLVTIALAAWRSRSRGQAA